MATGFDAKTDAADVATSAKTKGIEGATQAFQKELDEIKNADPTSSDKNSYYSNLNAELEKSGVLPEMAANWAKANYAKLDADGNGISLNEIAIELSNIEKNSKEHAFLMSLKSNYLTLCDQDKRDFGFNNAPGISKKDLDKYADVKGGDRNNFNLAAVLTDNKNYLFNALDVAADGAGGRDGKISRSDIETFVKDLDTNRDGKVDDKELNNQALAGVETEDRRKAADLLQKYADKDYWQSESTDKITEDGKITMDELAKGLGFRTDGSFFEKALQTIKDHNGGGTFNTLIPDANEGNEAGMLEAVKQLTGDDPTQSNEDQARAKADKDLLEKLTKERDAATAKASEGTTPLADYDRAMIEAILSKNKDATALVCDSAGVISKAKLDALFMGMQENPDLAAAMNSDALKALAMLQASWKTVSKDGKTLDLQGLSPEDFSGSGNGSGSEGTQNPEESEPYVVETGDSFWAIAQKMLGDGASNADIQAYMEQIAQHNGMDLITTIYKGDKLKLPVRPSAQ